MLYMNSPEALLAVTEGRRMELGQRSTTLSHPLPFDGAFRERSRPVVRQFRNQPA